MLQVSSRCTWSVLVQAVKSYVSSLLPTFLTFLHLFGAFSGLNFIAARPRARKGQNQVVPSNQKSAKVD